LAFPGSQSLLFLDDGIGAASPEPDCAALASKVSADLRSSGLVVYVEKSDFSPRQSGEFLGYNIDLFEGLFLVPERKVSEFMDLLSSSLAQKDCIPARTIASVNLPT